MRYMVEGRRQIFSFDGEMDEIALCDPVRVARGLEKRQTGKLVALKTPEGQRRYNIFLSLE